MPALPSGTVAFLISEVVDSTSLWTRFPNEWAAALATHESILRAAFAARDGYEFGTAGDSFGVAFATAADAVAAGGDAQRAMAAHEWVGAAAVVVRIGVTVGHADERDGKYFGPSVNLAARLAAIAPPGSVLVAETAARLAMDTPLGDEFALVGVGEHQLRSFPAPVRVFQVTGEGLSGDLLQAPISSARLPTVKTAYIGRSEEIAELVTLTRQGGLVTVTGIGGLGKTRTSLEVARGVGPDYDDGVWWIDLASLTSSSSIAPQVATTMGLTQSDSVASTASIVRALASQNTLLVLDNCEQIIDGAAAFVLALLEGCPRVGVLATSRTPLGLAGERNWPLSPLRPAGGAVELLLDRARTHDPAAERRPWPHSDLVALCERLDGLPLAIEMAAARLRTLSPAEIIERLDDRFALLRKRDRGTAARHQTMQAALDWSYELLDPAERVLLDRLSVFSGSFNLASVEAVCAGEGLERYEVIDAVTNLVDHSLVSTEHGVSGTRYRLYEVVRGYGDAHLDDGERVRLRHGLVDHVAETSVRHDQLFLSTSRADFDVAMAAFDDEWDNLRRAFEWAIESARADVCEVILKAVWIYSQECFRTEIVEWARLAFAMENPPPLVYAMVASAARSLESSRELALQALELIDESTPDHAAALCYSVLYWGAVAGHDAGAAEYAKSGLFHAEAMGEVEEAFQHANLAALLIDDDPEAADAHAAAAHEYVARSDNPLTSTSAPSLATFEARRGRPEVGYQLCAKAAQLSSDAGLRWTWATVLVYRAAISLRYDVGDPRADLCEAIRVARQQRALYAIWRALDEAVHWCRASGHEELAAIIEHNLPSRRTASSLLEDGLAPSLAAPGSAGSWGDVVPVLTRDELIERVLAELDPPPIMTDSTRSV